MLHHGGEEEGWRRRGHPRRSLGGVLCGAGGLDLAEVGRQQAAPLVCVLQPQGEDVDVLDTLSELGARFRIRVGVASGLGVRRRVDIVQQLC